jgi:hypothetical protein
MAEADDLDEKLLEARRRLGQLPGVVGVGFGYKERAGSSTRELCFRVYVRQKKPMEALAPGDVIPSEILGYRTDVLTVPVFEEFGDEILDHFEPLEGGIGISPLKLYDPATQGGDLDIGTLGFFGTIDGEGGKDNIVLLTNNHVLAAGGAAARDEVYQPRVKKSGNSYSLERNHRFPIGTIHTLGKKGHHSFAYPPGPGQPQQAPLDYYVDCATARVATNFSSWCDTNCGIGYEPIIHGLNLGGTNAVAGIERITAKTLPNGSDYLVYKVGRTTGRTRGKVLEACGPANRTRPDGTIEVVQNVLIIEDLGSTPDTRPVADHGDSGSVVVNGDRKVVALLYGGGPKLDANGNPTAVTIATCCHIHPVLDVLKITLLKQGASSVASGGGTALHARAAVVDAEAAARAAVLRGRILASEQGRQLRALVERHRAEVVYLVNRVRPVTVAWHRARGPDFLAHVLHASRHAGYPVPRELEGVARAEALSRLGEVLRRHGSPALREDLERHGERLHALAMEVDEVEAFMERLR